jgi:uncharacterized membrane protein (TIGR02234 family)
MPAEAHNARRTFAPVVLAGLGAAVLTAVAGNQVWVDVAETEPTDETWVIGWTKTGEVPLAGALSLVVLACWGVLLVSRGRVRRVVAVFGLVAAVGVLATVVVGFWSADDAVSDALIEIGASGYEVSHTGWYWVALVAALLSVAATALAVRWAPAWPAMGAKYDAPAGGAAAAAAVPPAEELSETELWKAIDEGRDPTALD